MIVLKSRNTQVCIHFRQLANLLREYPPHLVVDFLPFSSKARLPDGYHIRCKLLVSNVCTGGKIVKMP